MKNKKEQFRELLEKVGHDVTRAYPDLKKIIKKGHGNFQKFIKAFDMKDYNNTDVYAIRDAISDALDKSGTSFNYDKMTSMLLKHFS